MSADFQRSDVSFRRIWFPEIHPFFGNEQSAAILPFDEGTARIAIRAVRLDGEPPQPASSVTTVTPTAWDRDGGRAWTQMVGGLRGCWCTTPVVLTTRSADAASLRECAGRVNDEGIPGHSDLDASPRKWSPRRNPRGFRAGDPLRISRSGAQGHGASIRRPATTSLRSQRRPSKGGWKRQPGQVPTNSPRRSASREQRWGGGMGATSR
jgi:hypothetical protein